MLQICGMQCCTVHLGLKSQMQVHLGQVSKNLFIDRIQLEISKRAFLLKRCCYF